MKRLYRVELRTVAYVLAADEREADKIAERAVIANDHSFDCSTEEVAAGHEIEPGWSLFARPYADARTDRRRLRTVAEYVAAVRQ